MSIYRAFQIKWYHLLLGFLGILVVLAVLAWILLAKDGPSYFVEDETDIVES